MSPTPDSTLDPQQLIAELQRQLAEAVAERNEAQSQKAAIAEILGVINASPGDLKAVFDALLERAMRLCDANVGTLWTYDGEGFLAEAMQGATTDHARWATNQRRRGGPGSISGQLIGGENLIHIADAADTEAYRSGDPVRREMVDVNEARTLLAVALRKDDRLLGYIIIYRREVRPFTDKQIALLQNFAAQAVIAMENARLITETREALDQQTATAQVLQVINASPGDLAPVFETILDKACILCGAAHGALFTLEGESFQCRVTHGMPESFAEVVRQPIRSETGSVHDRLLRGEQFVHIPDIAASAVLHPVGRAALEAGSRTVLVVPLRNGADLLGYITAYRQEVRPFSDKQIALLQNFAAQAVIAMENARLINETREALEQQTATAEVLQVINSSPGDLVPVFDAMLDKAMRLCGFDYGSLQTYDGQVFRAVAVRVPSSPFGDLMRQPFKPDLLHGEAPLARLMNGAPYVQFADMAELLAQGHNDIRTRSAVELGGIRTALFVPLRTEGALLGYISALRKEVCPFTDKQIALLQNFAAQAVIAMENARLVGELRQRTEEVGELNRDLEARVAEQVDELGRVGRLKRFLAPQLAELIVSQGDEKILESHRREIVVVFCDLRGYTAFTETAEPEEVLDFLREYHGALGPLVSQFEGTLDQFSGDGIMVFFNDPVPIPDPAERAVKMAVAMRSAANTLIADWRERGRDFGFGAGIAQGYATLGQIGFSERSGYTAIGTVCNVAARLCGEAKDGQILLGQRVNVALKGSIATEQLGPLALKGLTQPVVAYNVPLGAIQPALRVIEGGSPETV